MTEPIPSSRPRRFPLRLTGRQIAAGLFLLTVASVAHVGERDWTSVDHGWSGWTLAAGLLTILVAHELGHYVVARWHGEHPSPPYFLPLPWFNPFGTLGAVLLLDDRERSRDTLLDIGAAGPWAGMLVAIPMTLLGLSLSPVEPLAASGYAQEGQSLVYWGLKHLVLGPIPDGYDVVMHPLLGGAWAGLYVTFLNLIPIGQLDGGHVAYALLGPRRQRLLRWVLLLPSALLMYNALDTGLPLWWSANGDVFAIPRSGWLTLLSAVIPWAVLQLLFAVMIERMGHPPMQASRLSPSRRALGWATLALWLLLFVPSPWVVH